MTLLMIGIQFAASKAASKGTEIIGNKGIQKAKAWTKY
jgi:hypothetical protein